MDVFLALSDPSRRQVLELLRGAELTAGAIGRALPHHSQPSMSRHLRVLREARLVRVRSEEQRRLYSLDPAGLREIDAWIQHYRGFWNDHLDALERHLDDEARTASPKTTTKRKNRKKERSP